ncbi:sensor histidine kinase [Sediminibacterium ginsengisoli]|uniref:Signal transduction histidine kinase n=1 Tax=Sediminibacterium ginsengisoli TaxID=413434 RepID=A0A1T4M9V0_9BACT|nr:ATP-binding protein [Sediminibacterium ginsengisoli]SJZ63617.1 Signal transduction histidine kinase [Sediminibacterium ginsengisoli]
MQVSANNIIVIVILTTCIFLIAAMFLLSYVRLYNKRKRKYQEEKEELEKQLMQSQMETREETLNQLGKELHDNVGQLLNSTKLLIGVVQRTIPDPPETLKIADETLGKAIQELRSLSKSLNKEWLEQFSFVDNLQAEVARINATKSLAILFSPPASLQLKPDKQVMLFRIVQEVLQNAIKHANASSIHIKMHEEAGRLHASISDDGSGFEALSSKSGVGILNIKHRTHLLGGIVDWQSSPNGTVVTLQIPVNTPEA